jgi:hypothetical protein
MKVYLGNREPMLDELLDDPVVRLLMAGDRLAPETARRQVEAARRRLCERASKDAADRR